MKDFGFLTVDPDQNYGTLFENFLSSKQTWTSNEKFSRGNQEPLTNRELQEETYIKSKLRNNFWREPSVDNKAAYKKQISKCVKIRRKH